MTGDPEEDTFDRVQHYRQLVLRYEKIDAEIDALIMASGGMPENMSTADRGRYRELALQRAELQNEMRWWEQQLMDDDETQH
jgi:hypothetical protein